MSQYWRRPLKSIALLSGLTLFAMPALAQQADDLVLPDGFQATVFHDGVGPGRHIAIRENGDVYVATRQSPFVEYDPAKKVGIAALRDTDGDGVADLVRNFSDVEGTGIQIYRGMLYASDDVAVYRFHFDGDELVPKLPPEVIAGGFARERQHADKTFAIDPAGHLYVNVGAPANACQAKMRTPGSPGMRPCPLLERYGGIWRFDADRRDQTQLDDGVRYATGIRNAVALDWNREAGALYIVMHGRDQLDTLWPALFTAEDNAERPAEEMYRLTEGGNYGWPYTYFDVKRGERMLGPEYGGDGKTPAPSGEYPDPPVAFPAHWGPNDLVFYDAQAFPESYRGGAIIAFHGSWNRAPLPQAGYKVVFQPFAKGQPAGDWQVFIDNFTGGPLEANSPRNARYRPTGLAVAPDGALFVVDSVKGRIWRISYRGS